jgi:hypothetical protein
MLYTDHTPLLSPRGNRAASYPQYRGKSSPLVEAFIEVRVTRRSRLLRGVLLLDDRLLGAAEHVKLHVVGLDAEINDVTPVTTRSLIMSNPPGYSETQISSGEVKRRT